MNENEVLKDPNMWQFLVVVWKDHPYIFVLLAFLLWGSFGAVRNKTSFIEYWINGYTPHFLKRKSSRKSKKSRKTNKTQEDAS